MCFPKNFETYFVESKIAAPDKVLVSMWNFWGKNNNMVSNLPELNA